MFLKYLYQPLQISSKIRFIEWNIPNLEKYFLGISIACISFFSSTIISLYLTQTYTEKTQKMQIEFKQRNQIHEIFFSIPEISLGDLQDIQKNINQRNIFNSDNTLTTQSNGECGLTRSNLPYLIGGMIYGGVSKNSVVFLQHKTTQATGNFEHGDSIPEEDYKIIEIEKDRIILQKEDSECFEYIPVEEEKPKDVEEKKTSTIISDQGYSEEGFVRQGLNIQVDRRWMDSMTQDHGQMQQILRAAKADPVWENGKITGWAMKKIIPGSIYEKLGVKDGDVIQSINNTSLDSIPRAVGTLRALQSGANIIVVKAKRDGQDIEYKINVR